MKKILLSMFILILWSCNNSPEGYIPHLNGYWEIEEVTLADGSKREYTFSDTIDFIKITDSLTGFRKKMKPDFDGTFSTSDDVETLKIKIENDSLNIYYKTPYAEWKETILKATEDRMIVINQKKIRYTYKRFEPISVE